MKTKTKIDKNMGGTMIGKLVVLALFTGLILVPAVSAIPPLPCEFYGRVEIDGTPAPAGTVITAIVNGSVKGTTTTAAPGQLGGTGTFEKRLVVSAREEDTAETPAPEVIFYVNGFRAEVADTFGPGESHEIVLVARSLKAFPDHAAIPADLNGDGIYEDLNGNGRLDFADVVLYFQQMQWIAENEPVAAFDLNGNGRIDFADVVVLFNEI